MTTTVELDTTTVHPAVATAYQAWVDATQQADGQHAARHRELIAVAEAADQPLCIVWGRLCCTPHGLDYRSCCDTWVCEEHTPEHDRHCKEFLAQLREERL